ncbi:hypothetical protein [uncultured Chryseobacterium sp.]|uniref:hypothetical protein n=1 Tax=uncultured Chryseobacterium sp. TaxID=259322 RepID=UPI0025D562AF|nr:hypothetical protein [uncultured Chryseobacterium sp.]
MKEKKNNASILTGRTLIGKTREEVIKLIGEDYIENCSEYEISFLIRKNLFFKIRGVIGFDENGLADMILIR